MSSTTSTGLIVAGTIVAISILYGSLNHTAKEREGKRWLEYGLAMKGSAVFFIVVMLACMVASFFVPESEKKLVPFLVFGPAVIAVPLLVESFGTKIAFDERMIYSHSGWRRARTVPWADIVSCSFSQGNSWWVLTTKDQGRIRIHSLLSGRDSFFVALNEKTGLNPGGEYADVF